MKKMRRLIPAVAMLMVAAVMLSTASFAWFTMNDQVTATGMQIQAKSTGSLVISDAPLTNASIKTTADLGVTTAQTIKPITWDETATAGWKTPVGDVNPLTGMLDDNQGLAAVTGIDNVKGEYFVDKDVYIGSAGDTLVNQQLTITLSAIAGADELASKAYAVAVYVINPGEANWANDSYATLTEEPDAVIYTDTLKDAGATYTRNMIVLAGTNGQGYTIPSIVGIEGSDAQGQPITTGLKVVLRFFVDGNLQALQSDGVNATKTKEIVEYVKVGDNYIDEQGNQQTVSTVYSDSTTYYYYDDAGDIQVANTTNLTDGEKADLTSLVNGQEWYVRVVTHDEVEYKYVNSAAVPTTGTSLNVTFTAATVANAQPNP